MAVTAPTGKNARSRREHRPKAGRPIEIDRPVIRPDGTESTVLELLCDAYRIGSSTEAAAAWATTHRTTVNNWIRAAGLLATAVAMGTRNPDLFTTDEQALIRFLVAVDQARAEGQVVMLGINDRLARGGIPITTTTVKYDAKGEETERTVKVEETLPDGAAARWRLERSWPNEFGRRIAVTGPDGGALEVSVHDRAEGLADQLRAYLQGQADAAKAAKQAKAIGA